MSAPGGQGAEGRFWKQGGITRRQGDFHDTNADATFGRLILWRTEVYPPTTEIHMYEHLGPVVWGLRLHHHTGSRGDAAVAWVHSAGHSR